jgi:hypothetical protein
MTPRSLLNLGIFIVVIVLAAIAFYPRQQTQPTTPTVQLFPVNKTDVQSIRIEGPKKAELRFHKQDQQWFMTAPVKIRAAEHQITTLLNILEQPADHKLPVEKSSLSQYGLDKSRFTLYFNDLPLVVGGSDPIHQRRYVMAQDAVYLVDDSFSRWLAEGAGAFIDAALLPPGSIIKKIQLPDFEVVKTETKWQYNATNPSTAANTPHYSQDSLQTFIDEWRYGRGLQVSLLSAPYKLANERQFKVFLQNQAEPIVFYEQSSGDDTAFVRGDLNISYHLTKDTVQRLTKVMEQKDIEPNPDAEPENEPTVAGTTS